MQVDLLEALLWVLITSKVVMSIILGSTLAMLKRSRNETSQWRQKAIDLNRELQETDSDLERFQRKHQLTPNANLERYSETMRGTYEG